MARYLWLRLDAPLLAFGGVAIDNLNRTDHYPATSLLTGLCANALGWDHADVDALDRLQARLRYAVRADVPGELLTDFHTVQLGQQHLALPGWTSWGRVEKRAGGSSDGTHIRYREYLADAVYTVALTIEGEGAPTVTEVEAALQRPARPLFVGRKCCLPSRPLLLGSTEAATALAAVRAAPRAERRAPAAAMVACWWPADEPAPSGTPVRVVSVTDQRRWRTQVHGGERRLAHARLPWQEAA